MNYGYIGRTSAWYGDDDIESIFIPDYWKWVDSPNQLAGDVHELTEEGNELLSKWCNDASAGYDLCFGRMKGLAAEYSREEIYQLITGDEKYSKPIEHD